MDEREKASAGAPAKVRTVKCQTVRGGTGDLRIGADAEPTVLAEVPAAAQRICALKAVHDATFSGRCSGSERGTSAGQGIPSGQFAENQRMTMSYFLIVNVVSSSRSKKRQSFAAWRATVTISMPLAAA